MKPLPESEREKFLIWMEKYFGIPSSLFTNLALFLQGKDIWVTTKEAAGVPLSCVMRRGMRIAKKGRCGYRLATPAIQYFGSLATRRVIDLTPDASEKYMRGEDMFVGPSITYPKGQVIVRCEGKPLGSGLLIGNRIKNQIPIAQRIRGPLRRKVR